MIREYRIMKALKPVFGAVPEVLAYSDDESIIGAEFYVMRRVEGQVAGEKTLPAEWGFLQRRFAQTVYFILVKTDRTSSG